MPKSYISDKDFQMTKATSKRKLMSKEIDSNDYLCVKNEEPATEQCEKHRGMTTERNSGKRNHVTTSAVESVENKRLESSIRVKCNFKSRHYEVSYETQGDNWCEVRGQADENCKEIAVDIPDQDVKIFKGVNIKFGN